MSKIKQQAAPIHRRVVLKDGQAGCYWHDGGPVRGPFDTAESARFNACVALADQCRVVVFVNEHGARV